MAVLYCKYVLLFIYEHEWNPEINVFYKRFFKNLNPSSH
jgi:hypothetical protein